MGPTIKNEKTGRPVSELHGLAGDTKQRSPDARIRRMRAISEHCAVLVGPNLSSTEHGELLYDERGLPK